MSLFKFNDLGTEWSTRSKIQGLKGSAEPQQRY